MTSRRQQSHTNLVVLHSSSGVDENDIKVLFPCFEIITGEKRLRHKGDSALTIVDRFSSDTCSVFAIAPLEQLYLAIGRSINSKHAQISHMYAKLFNGSTPGEREAIFRQTDHSIRYNTILRTGRYHMQRSKRAVRSVVARSRLWINWYSFRHR